MRLKLIILGSICPFALFSQIKVAGQVLEKETNKPIAGVVVYTDDRNKATVTDEQGFYRLEINHSESVYFRQLAYDFLKTTTEALVSNPNIYLTRNVVELSEITISPFQAEKILNKAFQNLHKKYSKDKKKYLSHIHNRTDNGGEREAFAVIEIQRSHAYWKKSIYWDWYLNELDIIKDIEKDVFYVNKKPLSFEFYPQRLSSMDKLNPKKTIYELYENEDNRIVIKVSPNHLDKKHYRYFLYTINKQDTVLTEYIGQSFIHSSEFTLKKIDKNINLQILNHFSEIKFTQDETNGMYYIKEVKNLGTRRILSGSSYTESFYGNSFVIENASDIQLNSNKNIKPVNYILFEIDFPKTPGFWKEYIK